MIRSFTIGLPLESTSVQLIEETVIRFHGLAMKKIASLNWPVRTFRITLPPLREAQESDAYMMPARLNSISRIADKCGVRWFCLPLDLINGARRQGRLDMVLDSIRHEQKMFVNLMVADAESIGFDAIRDVSRFIINLSRMSNNGVHNFKVGVSCNCPPNAPFFPFSRHESDRFRFSIALETTPIALRCASRVKNGHGSLRDFSIEFSELLTTFLMNVDSFAKDLSSVSGLEYAGLDASLAPFPDGKMSVAKLLEDLGASPVGCQGTLFLTSALSDVIKQSIKRSKSRVTGFNGVMFSVLEDDYLALSNNRRDLSISSLVSYATVCGCGLDMVPLPGITTEEDVAAIVLDIAALAVRLNKPLGVRVLPIPNKNYNEFTEFNSDFLCDSRIMEMRTTNSAHEAVGPIWRYASSHQWLDE